MIVGLYFVHNIPREAVLMEFPPFMNANNMWANFLYVNNFLPINRQYMGWCWSLAIEEQFYLILPGFILIVMRVGRPMRMLGGLMVLAGIIRWIVIDPARFRAAVPRSAEHAVLGRPLHDRVPEPLYALRRAALWGDRRLPDGVPPRARADGSSRARVLVDALAVASVAIIIPTGYFAMSSPLFTEVPVGARKLYYSHHRDVFALARHVPRARRDALGRIRGSGAPASALLAGALSDRAGLVLALSCSRDGHALAVPKDRRALRSSARCPRDDGLAALIALVMSFAGATILYSAGRTAVDARKGNYRRSAGSPRLERKAEAGEVEVRAQPSEP